METVQFTEEVPLPSSGQAQTQAQARAPAQAGAAATQAANAPAATPAAPQTMLKVSERQMVKRGTFKQVVESLESYKAAGITTYGLSKFCSCLFFVYFLFYF